MPVPADVVRLLSYYQSPMFCDAFREKMMAGGEVAAQQLQHLVEQMRKNFAREGYIPSGDDIALQEIFLNGGLGLDKMLEIARTYGVASISLEPR